MKSENNTFCDKNCFFVGFSIRNQKVTPSKYNKPGCEIVSMDTSPSLVHPLLARNDQWTYSNFPYGFSDLRYSYPRIQEVYSLLKQGESKIYSIFGYAIAKEDYYRHYDGLLCVYGISSKECSESNGELPNMTFCGYDVIDIESAWFSAFMAYNIPWQEAEKCGILNKHHLFSEYEHAKCLADKARDFTEYDERFAVWAIYKVLP